MRVPEPKRRDVLMAALASPMSLALTGCSSPLPVSLTATTSAAAQSLLNESAAAHGTIHFRASHFTIFTRREHVHSTKYSPALP